MPIKDKITSELKSRFVQDIRTTIETGKERGFLICRDDKDRLSATTTCEGENCTINLTGLTSQCRFKIQGGFHTHPTATDAREYVKQKLGRDVPLEDAKKIVRDIAKNLKVSLAEPSYGDLLGTISLKYEGHTLGTTCIGTDIEPDKVECWTINNKISKDDFDIATMEIFRGIDLDKRPLQWAKDLFDKEIIDLK